MSQQALTGKGVCEVEAAPEVVWSELLDPQVLAALIPGTERVVRDGDRYEALLSYGAGRVRAQYNVDLVVSDLMPPDALSLAGQSEGRLGWGKARAVVTLESSAPGRTTIRWEYDGTIGGPVALLGGLVLRSAARVFVGRFFDRLARRLAAAG